MPITEKRMIALLAEAEGFRQAYDDLKMDIKSLAQQWAQQDETALFANELIAQLGIHARPLGEIMFFERKHFASNAKHNERSRERMRMLRAGTVNRRPVKPKKVPVPGQQPKMTLQEKSVQQLTRGAMPPGQKPFATNYQPADEDQTELERELLEASIVEEFEEDKGMQAQIDRTMAEMAQEAAGLKPKWPGAV